MLSEVGLDRAVGSRRLPSIDVLRGLIMVFMALDHVGLMVGRFHSQEMWAGAWTRYADAVPFLTRFVTHFCAPGFFLLMGAGIALSAQARMQRGWPPGRITRYILLRGAILVAVATVLEVPAFLAATLSGPSLGQNPEFAIPGMTQPRWVLTVLFALGASMMIAAVFIRARAAVWGLLAAAALLVTAITTPGPEHFDTDYSFARTVLMVSRWSHGVWSQYPIIPWFGIAALGVLLGRWISADQRGCFRALPWIGLTALLAAVTLRAAGGFGNFRAPRDRSWIEFLNFIKYPPALTFTLFMVGGDLLALAAIERIRLWTNPIGGVLQVFGQAPLAYYIAHLWLFAIIGMIWFRQGTSYGVVYLVWLAGLVPLYYFARWFRNFKKTKPPDSVWRLF
ncbi:MAG TPA: heparan-alpha-glucosaminide N-acetyltransferase domain-containing protein [Vicinamibacterales bacterium]|nr:heparan-alpha-glucosaminide N-acetyltransferase domain-containing protein [Vicinamibacterales bacterium]